MMRSLEYRMLRRGGLLCCCKCRAKIAEYNRILRMAENPQERAAYWAIQRSWRRRWKDEQRLLAALRISVQSYRQLLIVMRPRGTFRLLGLDKDERTVYDA